MLLELPHKIGLAVIAAGLSYGSDRQIGVFKELRRMDKTALDNVLSECNAEGFKINSMEVCPAYLHILAHFLHRPASRGIVIYCVAELPQLGIARYIFLGISLGIVRDITHGDKNDTHGKLHELAEMLSAMHGLRPH